VTRPSASARAFVVGFVAVLPDGAAWDAADGAVVNVTAPDPHTFVVVQVRLTANAGGIDQAHRAVSHVSIAVERLRVRQIERPGTQGVGRGPAAHNGTLAGC
jgi:hypothetical protein